MRFIKNRIEVKKKNIKIQNQNRPQEIKNKRVSDI